MSKALVPMIVAGTGHRPEDCEDELGVRTKARVALEYRGADIFICGMAAGYDLWAGDEARKLGLEIWAAKPWRGHGPRKGDEELYQGIIEHASKVVNVVDQDEFPGAWCYHKRNEWMVDNCTHLMAYWNGKEKGGTFACLNYAKSLDEAVRPKIRNIYHDPPF